MNETDQIVSPPVGIYRKAVGRGLHYTAPYYASRWHTLTHPMVQPENARTFQVLVPVMGTLEWINIDPHAILNDVP